ncbi:Rv2732c family membrane protein [Kibdelosporangium aridum]|uniref:Uncharacterized protein n=1 Tax=Kibdelosporangium aridum TaxID=2030 RepID=A0A1Y5Y0X4_KIBAR|nr:hypothetical protein [Kibdelosporangium aridum]SMD23462.1 hypothetical protein SAMN05661093_07990 [Kibdelosporangium aridum]
MSEVDHLREEIDAVERKAIRTVDLGARAIVISAAVMVLLIGQLLPWINGANGWQVLLGHVEGKAGVVPRLFAATSVGFGVLASMLALITRRWALTWVCAIGGWFASVDGVLAIWSRQSTPDASPGIGLVIAEIAMVVIATYWFRAAWSRPDLPHADRATD